MPMGGGRLASTLQTHNPVLQSHMNQIILDELDYVSEITEDELDVSYLQSARIKLEKSESLSENELQVVTDEFQNWMTKDLFQSGKEKSALIEAMYELGLLDEYSSEDYYSRKPKTKVINGKKYIIW